MMSKIRTGTHCTKGTKEKLRQANLGKNYLKKPKIKQEKKVKEENYQKKHDKK